MGKRNTVLQGQVDFAVREAKPFSLKQFLGPCFFAQQVSQVAAKALTFRRSNRPNEIPKVTLGNGDASQHFVWRAATIMTAFVDE
jgi:hypothetical protein